MHSGSCLQFAEALVRLGYSRVCVLHRGLDALRPEAILTVPNIEMWSDYVTATATLFIDTVQLYDYRISYMEYNTIDWMVQPYSQSSYTNCSIYIFVIHSGTLYVLYDDNHRVCTVQYHLEQYETFRLFNHQHFTFYPLWNWIDKKSTCCVMNYIQWIQVAANQDKEV